MSEIKTFYTDSAVPKAGFNVKENLGSNPAAKIPTEGAALGTVTPKELPVNSLKFGDKG